MVDTTQSHDDKSIAKTRTLTTPFFFSPSMVTDHPPPSPAHLQPPLSYPGWLPTLYKYCTELVIRITTPNLKIGLPFCFFLFCFLHVCVSHAHISVCSYNVGPHNKAKQKLHVSKGLESDFYLFAGRVVFVVHLRPRHLRVQKLAVDNLQKTNTHTNNK